MPGLSMIMRFPWESYGKSPIGWDGTARIAFSMGPMGQYYIAELSLSKTVDEQEIENLLNEHSDLKYECQNDNELLTFLNFKVNKDDKFCRFLSHFVGA